MTQDSKMKFKIGQKVQLKKLSDIKNRGAAYPTIVFEMEKFCGTLGKIYGVSYDMDNVPVYQIRGWSWRDDWIELQEFLTDEDFDF